jgi:GNAT superfamily N-acetyltransferase
MTSSDVSFRRFGRSDIPFAHELKNIAGWNQTQADWEGYCEFEPEGCFVAETCGRPVGTATTIRYADGVGWIGMVLVHPDFRRGGIGTLLLRHAIDYLRRMGTPSIKLDATPMGRKVYVPLGFVDEYEVARYEGVAPPTTGLAAGNVSPLTSAQLAGVAAFDTPVFGADRTRVLAALSRRNPEYCFVATDAGRVSGYLIAREGHQAIQLGPWVAQDSAVAERLLLALFARVGGRRILVDVPGPNRVGREQIEQYGFAVQRGFTRMFLGSNPRPGFPEKFFGTGGAEKG